MGENWLRMELGLDDDDEIAEGPECFECGTLLDLEEGLSVTLVSAEYVHDLGSTRGPADSGVPNALKGRRVRQGLRDYVRKRDRRTCQVCDRVLKLDQCTMHHIKPVSNEGRTSPDNLVVACEDCNQRIADKEVPRVTILNTEFVRELSSQEHEAILELTLTEEEHEARIQECLANYRGRCR